jgi:hypothetical protein
VFKKWIAVALLAVGFSTAASANNVTWTDSINFNPDVYIGPGSSYTYTHDITDNGFNPWSDILFGYSLSLNLYDDSSSRSDGNESAFVDMPGLLGDETFFNLSGSEFGGWSLIGHLILQVTGTLTVTVDSLWGDFYLGGSVLTAYGESKHAVPEPDALGLLGLALVGGALARRFVKRA